MRARFNKEKDSTTKEVTYQFEVVGKDEDQVQKTLFSLLNLIDEDDRLSDFEFGDSIWNEEDNKGNFITGFPVYLSYYRGEMEYFHKIIMEVWKEAKKQVL